MAVRPYGGNPKIGVDDLNVVLKFGGGLHTKASPDEIDPREAAGGFNFDIDLQDRNLRSRAPFDLIGTVPNGQPIQGGGSLLKTDGTVTTIVQAGGVVYEWDGQVTFTSVGTCNSSSKLRGHWQSHTWNLTDKLLLTDLALQDVVKEWNGTTFQSSVFTDELGHPFGTFFAKYLDVTNELALFANVRDPGATTPQLIIGSARSNYNEITLTNRPSSAISDSDPFFLISPDLKPINGIVDCFGTAMISTEKGQIFNLSGSSAQDFSFSPFYPNSAASGGESIINVGDDIIYGRQGRIESVIDTNTFGNSQASDITTGIADVIAGYSGWMSAFNSRTRRSYMFPAGVSECWVLDSAVQQAGQISPWMRWSTQHPMAFQPSFVMSMLDPIDGLEYIFMGDDNGNFYRLEGTGANGDGGTSAIEMQFLSKLFPAQLDSVTYDMEGYLKYAKNDAATVSLTFQYQGVEIFDKSVSVNLPEISAASFYGDDAFYNGNFFYGSISGRFARQKFFPPGDANEFQLLIDYVGTTGITINEIGLRFRGAGQ